MSLLQCSGSASSRRTFRLAFSFSCDAQRRSPVELCLFYCIFALTDDERQEIDESPDEDVGNALVLRAIDTRGLSSLLSDDGSALVRSSLKSTFVNSRPERFGRSVLRPQLDQDGSRLQEGLGIAFAGSAVVNSYNGSGRTSVLLATVCDSQSGTPFLLGSNNSFVLCCILDSSLEQPEASAAAAEQDEGVSGSRADGTGRPMIQPLIMSSSWSPLVRPKRFASTLVSSAHVMELAAKFQKYVVGAAASKVCALRASRLVVPISVPDGFCSAQSTSFMTFLTDSQSVTAIHVNSTSRRADALTFEPLPPISILEVLLRNCRGESVRSIRPRLGLSLHQALEMGASYASFDVEWYDYLLLAAVPTPLWKTLNRLVDRYYDFVARNAEPIYGGVPVPATHQSFCMALQHIFHVAEGLRPSGMAAAEFRSKLVCFFGMDPADALHGTLSSRSFREYHHATGASSGLASSRLSIALGSPHQQAIPSWKRVLCYDSGRHRDLRNILGDIKVTPARVLWCLFPRAMQQLAVSQVDRSDRPLLVPKRRSMQLVRISALAGHQETAARQRLLWTYYAKLARFARLRRDLQRRRNLLAQSLQRRIESRSALPWFSKWRSFVTNKTRRRKSSIMYVSMLKKDELLYGKIMFRQWREFALMMRKLKVNTHRELLLESLYERALTQRWFERWLSYTEMRQERRAMQFASSSFAQSPSMEAPGALVRSGSFRNVPPDSLDSAAYKVTRSSSSAAATTPRDVQSRRGSLR